MFSWNLLKGNFHALKKSTFSYVGKKGVSLAVTTVHSGTNLTNLIALHISANITWSTW